MGAAMSRAGRSRPASDIPLKPEVVEAYEQVKLQQRHDRLYFACLIGTRTPCPPGEVIGAQIAQSVLSQVVQMMMAAQQKSGLVVP